MTDAGPAASVLFDPCSGLGSIPIELAAFIRRDMLRLVALSADNERPSLEGALQNAASSGVAASRGTHGLDAGVLWDGRGPPFSSGFREGVLGGVISDLPWGLRELSVNAVSKLYPLLLKRLGHACSDDAFGVFLVHRDKVFLMALQQNSSKWKYVTRRVGRSPVIL
jgi:23S rRNA G2445 N2-methylase RlmL